MAYFDEIPGRDERFFNPLPQSTDVLIVGAGPVGLFAAYCLSRQSISSVIVERHAHRLGQPKAHAINARSLEIFRQAGLDTEILRSKGVTATEGSLVRFVSIVNGEELGVLPYERQDEAVKDLTPEPLFNIAQPILEAFLQENALYSGQVSIHRRQEWLGYEEDISGMLKSIIRNRDNSSLHSISSRFILGADGVNSTVRATVPRISLDPLVAGSTPRSYISVHFTADLRPLVSHDIAQLYFCLDPSTNHASLIGYGNPSWVYARPLLPGENLETFTPAHCRRLINTAIGTTIPDIGVHSAQIWNTFPAICDSYTDPSYRIFLAGDSAHQFPPQGGLGVNTGISDVQNLVWKLGFVLLKENHDPNFSSKTHHLLSTYSAERIPVAKANAKQSSLNEENMRLLDAECLATIEPEAANGTGDTSKNGNGTNSGLFNKGDVHERIQGAIERNRDHFDSLGLQLGYIYGRSSETMGQAQAQGSADPCWIYEPRFESGARLPHAWIRPKPGVGLDALCRDMSTLDLTVYARFTLWTVDPERIQCLPGELEGVATVVDLRLWECPEEWLAGAWVDEKILVVRPDQHILGHADALQGVVELIQLYTFGTI
jgi:2-polyprenyl-6-methoxyphenol hydroxylase-like FAD-dependent oxidoreductase